MGEKKKYKNTITNAALVIHLRDQNMGDGGAGSRPML